MTASTISSAKVSATKQASVTELKLVDVTQLKYSETDNLEEQRVPRISDRVTTRWKCLHSTGFSHFIIHHAIKWMSHFLDDLPSGHCNLSRAIVNVLVTSSKLGSLTYNLTYRKDHAEN